MKFAHIADTHIRNLKYHKEYRAVFEQLYTTLREEKVDCIVHCGDIAHTKTQISPEFVQMCSDFLKNLADIAPTYIVLGNHDGNLRNSYRQDAISPITRALNHPNLHLCKNSGEVHINNEFCLNVLSVFDEESWTKPSDPTKINIAAYHGSIYECKTDIGWVMRETDHEINIFDDFDYAFLGDIHKPQVLNSAGTVAYPGSTIQQNFGEDVDKGILLWDIEGKGNFTCERAIFQNPKPFISVYLTKTGRIPNKFTCPPNARLRLISQSNIPLEKLRKAVDIAKSRFKPESVTFLNKGSLLDSNIEDKVDAAIKENLRDEKIQQELIKEYLKDYSPDTETLQGVFELNAKYNRLVEATEDLSRNVHWKVKKLQWNNLFNYAEDNAIDFAKLSGIVGIFGKNFSGKSSIIDSLLYTMYNNTSKNIRKTFNIINEHKEYGSGYLEIEANNKTYKITRRSDKYVKKLKGKVTDEAKTTLDFESVDHVSGEILSHNATERGGTEKNIRSKFGPLEDFLMTSMSSQAGALQFINEGSTRRKEILAKFLDLEFFEKKFKMAKEDAMDLRGALRRLEGREFDEEIKEAKNNIFVAEANSLKKKNECTDLQAALHEIEAALKDFNDKIDAVPAEPINIEDLKATLKETRGQISDLKRNSRNLKAKVGRNNAFIEKAKEFLRDFDIEDLKRKKTIEASKLKHLEELAQQILDEQKTFQIFNNQVKTLDAIPCGKSYVTSCQFIKEAYGASQKIDVVEKMIEALQNQETNIKNEIKELDPKAIDRHLDNYEKLVNKKDASQQEQTRLRLEIERNTNKIQTSEVAIGEYRKKIGYYNENKEAIEDYNGLVRQRDEKQKEVHSLTHCLESCNAEILELVGQQGATEQKLKNLQEQKQEKEALSIEYSAYDLFMRCMHSGGISFDLIKKGLPVINEEISKVLANVVEFEVFFENTDNKLDILIKHPKHESRPLENGSGAEKTLAAIAIRIALLNVSNMPKSNIFILDEPGTSLDADNMEGFVRILDLIKSYFNITLLITHVDSLKDVVDMTIDITKVPNGYAYVNQ